MHPGSFWIMGLNVNYYRQIEDLSNLDMGKRKAYKVLNHQSLNLNFCFLFGIVKRRQFRLQINVTFENGSPTFPRSSTCFFNLKEVGGPRISGHCICFV
jgi:hypothetical protein